MWIGPLIQAGFARFLAPRLPRFATNHFDHSLYPADDALKTKLSDELKRSEEEGHFGNELWCMKKDGTRFWANIITMALKNENGELQGFARVVRDFSERHERDEKLRKSRSRLRLLPAESTFAGIVSGEFDRIPDANDAFLDLVGYTREDLQAERLRWLDLTPPEHVAFDELAHEEALRFGACTPYEKELIRKDGTRVPEGAAGKAVASGVTP